VRYQLRHAGERRSASRRGYLSYRGPATNEGTAAREDWVSRQYRPRAGFWIRLCVIILYPLNSLFFRLRWHHLERIPEHGGVLLAVNHISQADTVAMARLVWQAGRIPRFLIKSTIFDWPFVRRVLIGAGQIPVYRGSADAQESLQAANDALRRGECVIIYPEGTITNDPEYWPMRGKTGVARLALDNPDIPILPVGQWGAHRTLGRRGRFRPVPRHRHDGAVGKPLDLSEFSGQPHSAAVLTAITEKIMAAITDEVTSLREIPRA
jgi:1-acyl-sn-glycerol-3-phosphate acyltransferase